MLRTMYDSVDATAIPSTATLIAGYVDGRDTAGNYAAIAHRFPHARLVSISTTGATVSARVGDIERGDMDPAGGAEFAHRKIHELGQHPTLYCSLSLWSEVERAVGRVGLDPHVDVSYWIAHYDGNAGLPPGAIAVQYASPGVPAGHPGHSPGRYDLSVVGPYWAGVDPVPRGMTEHEAHLHHLHHLTVLHRRHEQHVANE